MQNTDGSGSSMRVQSNEVMAAQKPCSSCKKRRRKCDRSLPVCLDCKLLNRRCEYTVLPKKQGRKAAIAPKQGGNRHLHVRSFPAQHFQSLKPFCSGSMFVLGPESLSIEVAIPNTVLQLLSGEIESIQDKYFGSVHRWMPILSIKRLRQVLSNLRTEPRADLALLLLSMKLIVDHPTPDKPDWARSTLYYAAKSLFRSIKNSRRYSTHLLQASLLLSLYELGHAIHPEAQVSVAANVELGLKLGINKSDSQRMYPAPSSWTESEERTRTWWGTVILDRYVSLGIRGRELSTPDPDGSHYVPVDDLTWENGFEDTPVPRKTLVAETPAIPGASIFEREAHASYLLGQAVNLKLGETQHRPPPIDKVQLSTTLLALSSLLRHDIDSVNGPYYCAAVGMCNSALLTLYTPFFLPRSPSHPILSSHDLVMHKRAADRVYELGLLFISNINVPGLIDTIAPLVPDSIYQAAVFYAFLAREAVEQGRYDQSYVDAYELMRKSLVIFDRRWKIAGSYLSILDAQFPYFSLG